MLTGGMIPPVAKKMGNTSSLRFDGRRCGRGGRRSRRRFEQLGLIEELGLIESFSIPYKDISQSNRIVRSDRIVRSNQILQ